MNERLTNEELAEIKERVEKASGSEWHRFSDNSIVCINEEQTLTDLIVRKVESYNEENDAVFIAHAREDIPKLLAEIEETRAMLDKALDGINDVTYEDLHTEVYDFLYGGDDE